MNYKTCKKKDMFKPLIPTTYECDLFGNRVFVDIS